MNRQKRYNLTYFNSVHYIVDKSQSSQRKSNLIIDLNNEIKREN